MWSLTIVFGPAATAWTLMFKTEVAAEQAYNDASANATALGSFKLLDDFGQKVRILNPVHGMMLEDMSLSSEARIERGLDQARSQAKAQERAMADPALMASMRRGQQGPAVLNPSGLPRMM